MSRVSIVSIFERYFSQKRRERNQAYYTSIFEHKFEFCQQFCRISTPRTITRGNCIVNHATRSEFIVRKFAKIIFHSVPTAAQAEFQAEAFRQSPARCKNLRFVRRFANLSSYLSSVYYRAWVNPMTRWRTAIQRFTHRSSPKSSSSRRLIDNREPQLGGVTHFEVDVVFERDRSELLPG